MSTKDRLQEQMERAAADQAKARALPQAPKPSEDVALQAAQEKVKDGTYASAHRTKNGALVKTRPFKPGSEKPEVLR